MALFEGYERRIDKINGVLNEYGIASIEEAKDICGKAGISPYDIVKSIQPIALGGHMMDAFAALGAPAVVVTFLDELASHGPETVSMMSTVKEEDPAQRTYKIIRKPPDGLAYAMYIAGKHGLTYEQLSRRLKK